MKNSNYMSRQASAGLLLTALIWGFAFVVVKSSLDKIDPFYMLAFRFSIATLGLSIIFFKRLKNINLSMLKGGFVLGLLLFIGYALQTVGCKYTTAGKNAFLTAAYVVMVPFLHRLINNQKTKKINIAAGFIALLGIGLLSLRQDFMMNIGDLLTLLCGVAFAVHMVFVVKYTANHDPVLLTVLQLGIAAVMSWIAAPIIDGGFPAEAFHTDIIGGMLYLGLMSTMLAFLLQNVCQKYISPSTAAILLSTESVFGIMFSIIFLAEKLSLRMAVGCVLIFVAIILSQLKLKKEVNKTA